jgi:prepilin peptidase CpaA
MIRGVVLAVALAAAFCDLRWRRIPNWLTGPAVMMGVGLNAWLGGWTGACGALQGLGLALLIHLPLFALRALGGGDVKLMAAIGSLVGPGAFLVIFVLNAVLGGVVALVVAVTKGRLARTLSNVGLILSSLSKGSAPEMTLDSVGRMAIPRGAVAAMAVGLWLLL